MFGQKQHGYHGLIMASTSSTRFQGEHTYQFDPIYFEDETWLRRARAIESTWFRSKHLRWFRWINTISRWQTSVIHVRNIQSMVGFFLMRLFCCISDVFDIFDILRCCSWPVEKPWPCAKKGGRRWKHPRLAHPSHSGTRSITPGPEVKS